MRTIQWGECGTTHSSTGLLCWWAKVKEPPCRAKLQPMLALGNMVGCCRDRAEGAGEVESRTQWCVGRERTSRSLGFIVMLHIEEGEGQTSL